MFNSNSDLDNFNFSAKGTGELGKIGALRFPLAGGAHEGGVHVAAVLGPEPVGFAWVGLNPTVFMEVGPIAERQSVVSLEI